MLTAVTVNGTAIASIADSMSKTDLDVGTTEATVVLTTSPKATVKVWQTDKDFGTLMSGTHDADANTYTYTLPVSTASTAFVIEVTSEVGTAKSPDYTLTLQVAAASSDATVVAADGRETDVAIDGAGTIKFASTVATKLTLGGLKSIVVCSDEGASYIVKTAAGGTEITDDGAVIPANAVIVVTAADDTEKTYTITFDKP